MVYIHYLLDGDGTQSDWTSQSVDPAVLSVAGKGEIEYIGPNPSAMMVDITQNPPIVIPIPPSPSPYPAG